MKKKFMRVIFSSVIVLSLFLGSKYYHLLNAEELLYQKIDPDFSESTEFIFSEIEKVDAVEVPFESDVISSEESDTELLSLDFEDTEITDVIRVLAEISGMNMVIAPDIETRVTLQLKDITWQQALDVILMTYNLTYKKEGNLIRVMTLDQMKIEEEKIPLVTKIVLLNFARADEIVPSLEKITSPRGSIQTNARTNSLIITDLPEAVEQIEDIANKLDTRTPQVMIEALIVDVKLSGDENLGINWDLKSPDDFPERTFSQTLSLAGSTSAAISFGKTILRDYDLHGLINMWKEDQRVDVLANPKVMTLDKLQATIELIEEIPYTSESSSTEGGSVTSTQFKESGIKLYVTPHITTKDNWISMNIQVEQSYRTGYTTDNQPIIDSRKAETNLMVKDSETIVIGGLRKKEDTTTIDKVPVLGDIPVLGNLFRRSTKTRTNIDLLIFVTPKIIEGPILTAKEKERLELFKEEPEDKTGISQKIRQRMERQKVKKKREEEIIEPVVQSPEESFSLRPPVKED